MRPRCRAISPCAQGVRFGGQFSTAEAQVLDASGKLLASGAAPISPRPQSLIHHPHGRWQNLGDLICRDREPDKIAIIDLGASGPNALHYGISTLRQWGRAQPLAAGSSAASGSRSCPPIGPSTCSPIMDHARRPGGGADQFQFARHHRLHPARLRRQARVCDPPRGADCAANSPASGSAASDGGFERFLDFGKFQAIPPAG